VVDHQEHVRSVAVDALSQLAELHASAGDFDKAIQTVDEALTLDPDPIEDLFRHKMLWQRRLGRPQAAHGVYRHLVRPALPITRDLGLMYSSSGNCSPLRCSVALSVRGVRR
jgi:tetratricopeptide (TPR) repeat protein